MKIPPVSKVAVCPTVRFADSGRIFWPRFARAPSDVGVSTASVASTNLNQNLSAIIPQTGEVSGLARLPDACSHSVRCFLGGAFPHCIDDHAMLCDAIGRSVYAPVVQAHAQDSEGPKIYQFVKEPSGFFILGASQYSKVCCLAASSLTSTPWPGARLT